MKQENNVPQHKADIYPDFSCVLCSDVRNKDQHVILDHIEGKHVKSSYECGECGIILPTREMMNAHKLKKHGNEMMKIMNSIASKYFTITPREGSVHFIFNSFKL